MLDPEHTKHRWYIPFIPADGARHSTHGESAARSVVLSRERNCEQGWTGMSLRHNRLQRVDPVLSR
jgi:hypothetical protein